MSEVAKVISPVDGRVWAEIMQADESVLERKLSAASKAKGMWRATPLSKRIELVSRLVDAIAARTALLSEELVWQMGRPIRYAAGELAGFDARARAMMQLAEPALAPLKLARQPGVHREIRRQPHGVVLVLAPWNYPWLTAVNAVVPALIAGNVVLLKHSDQTPKVAERFVEAGREAGLPEGVFDFIHMTHAMVANAVRDARVDHVAFTGSVEGGRAVSRAASERFIGVGLELGGKDPAYVRCDAPLGFAVENLVDGAFFNSGQSCCGIERIYVHQERYTDFVEAYVALTRQYVLDDPTKQETTLGPVVRVQHAQGIRAQVEEAIAQGAKALIDPQQFPVAAAQGAPYLAPQVLVDVDHSMRVMCEETFGPVVGIMAVRDDEEAVARMNDSAFGLTASVWTADHEMASHLGERIETGTFFVNRCDYLDPELAWVGVKDSGHGCSLSSVGYEHLTRPMSVYVRAAQVGQ